MKKKERIFAIGDIHGCFDRLTRLLQRLPYDPVLDTLVFLGDYIDRGNDSRQVIDLVCRLQNEGRVVTLFGNHEHLLLQYHATGDAALLPFLRKNGIERTLASYGEKDVSRLRGLGFLPQRHKEFLQGLLPYWETERYRFVHAGIRAGVRLEVHTPEQLCEGREEFWRFLGEDDKVVIFGHTAFRSPLVTERAIGIDTGAVYGNLLTAVELPRVRFYHA